MNGNGEKIEVGNNNKHRECTFASSSSSSSSNCQSSQRPRRNIMQKSSEFHNGLLWTEEKELKKALYASLQESKKSRLSESDGEDATNGNRMARIDKKRKSDAIRNGTLNSEPDSAKRAKVHAQRKFAQGSNPTSPSVTPIKFRNASTPSMDILPAKRPKTEDFLTFLCLRGTSVLPSALDFFNVACKTDLPCESRCPSPMNGDVCPKLAATARGPTKGIIKPQAVKPLKGFQPPMLPLSSTESSVNETDDELHRVNSEKRDALMKTSHYGAFRASSDVWQSRGRSFVPQSGALGGNSRASKAEPPQPVQQLKQHLSNDGKKGKTAIPPAVQRLQQKYREQRMAREKEAMVKAAKKVETAATNASKPETSGKPQKKKLGVGRPAKVSSECPAKKTAARSSGKASGGAKRKGSSGAVKSSQANKVPAVATGSTSGAGKPVTRHAVMLLQAAREKEEKSKLAASAPGKKVAPVPKNPTPAKKSAVVVPEQPVMVKAVEKQHLVPLLTTDHSYVKRPPPSPPPVVNASKSVTSAKKPPQSDFSTDDDEPLAKKQKNTKGKAVKGSAKTPSAVSSKALRSAKETPAQSRPEETVVQKTPAGRPSRKTKEAATVYLELLGQKLNAPDDEFDMPLVRKKKGAVTATAAKSDNKAATTPRTGTAKKKAAPPPAADTVPKAKKRGRSGAKEAQQPRTGSKSAAGNSSGGAKSSSCVQQQALQSAGAAKKTAVNKWNDSATRSKSFCQALKTPLERIGTVKTREFMKKLTEAQFKLAKAQGGRRRGAADHSRDTSPASAATTKSASPVAKKSATVQRTPAATPSTPLPKSASAKTKYHRPEVTPEIKEVTAAAKKRAVVKVSVRPSSSSPPLSDTHGNKPQTGTTGRSASADKKMSLYKLLHASSEHSSSSSSSTCSSSSTNSSSSAARVAPAVVKSASAVPAATKRGGGVVSGPYRRGPGRPSYSDIHRLSHLYNSSSSESSSPSSSSQSSSSSDSPSEESESESYENPSKPESTTISVRQNVTSTSVAVQVNLINDISDLDDDFWEPGFMDADLEGLFAMDRVMTPTLLGKGMSPNSRSRNSWDLETPSPLKAVSRSREVTPTANKSSANTPDRQDVTSFSGSGGKAAAKVPAKQQPAKSSTSTGSVTNASPAGPSKRTTASGSGKPMRNCQPTPASSSVVDDSSSDDETILPKEFHIPHGTSSGVKEAPIFYPTAAEFQDPLEYIEKIRPEAEKFGVCKIVPPASFKPECKVNDEMRFTAHNQYVHKMFNRWGQNTQQLAIIKKHMEAQGVEYDHPPLIGGMELDIPRLFNTVQQFSGLKEVIEKKKWQRVADAMKIGKSAQDRVTKLYDAYCKYLLSYDTLSKEEKLKLEQQVVAERQKKKARFTEGDECVTKGRSMALCNFYRIARNTMAMWFKGDNPKPLEVEHEYWQIVTKRDRHICVHAGNIDSSTYGYGFSCHKNSQSAKHPWNLKVLTNNTGSVLRCMGPVMGVTIPTLHVGMLFTTGCWYRDPHCLPWIEYLHTGASKIWYGVPASQSCKFREAMSAIVPEFCANTPIWLPSDTAMVPPSLLVEKGATLCRLVQHSGQFVVVFPRAFTSTICCGYTVSESVYFATADWLEIAPIAFKEISDSCEPAVFSLQRLLIGIANDVRVSVDVLQQISPLLKDIRENELNWREQLIDLGLKHFEHVPVLEVKNVKKRPYSKGPEQDYECEICRANCYISMVVNTQDGLLYCLQHAVEYLQKKKKDVKYCELLYTFNQAELNELLQKINDQIQSHNNAKKKLTKKAPAKKGGS